MTMWRLRRQLKRLRRKGRAERRRYGSSSSSSDASDSDSDSSSLSSRSRDRRPARGRAPNGRPGGPNGRQQNGRREVRDDDRRGAELARNVKKPVREQSATMAAIARVPPVALKPQDAKRTASILLNKEITDRNATYKSILSLFDRRGDAFDGVNLSTAIHRLGSRFARQRNVATDGTVRQIIDRATALIVAEDATYGAREVANTAWGVVKMGAAAPALFDAVATVVVARTGDFKPQELANVVWAYATARLKVPRLFDAVARDAPYRMALFKAQNIAHVSWAFAKVGNSAPARLPA